MIVVDASLAAKWIFWEDGSDAALAFLRRYQAELCAPDLILTEVAGIAVRLANTGHLSREAAEEATNLWLGEWGTAAVETIRSSRALATQAARLALELGHPIADCHYLALAIERRCDLATCDAKFRSKAIRLYDQVKLLDAYGCGSADG